MGRGRPVSARQNQRGAENERCTVSIEGLSSSTTDVQLNNLLRSIGPIEVGASTWPHVSVTHPLVVLDSSSEVKTVANTIYNIHN